MGGRHRRRHWCNKLIAAAASALAASPSVWARAADIELGRYLASECVTCHRSGTTAGTIPDIFGIAETTFAEVMKAYRDKQLANPVMQNIASRLSDEDIAALALYFSTTRKP